ncbi:MAG: phosphatidate cytidylyltransferase [Geminicoccaceae bacterium]|nr:phosphatidate cytidylyltransferase [Geminicoccaceae bacterium]
MALAPAETRDPALGQRIASGLVLAILACASVLAGGIWLAGALFLVLVLAAREWARLAGPLSEAARACLLLAPVLAGGAALAALTEGHAGLALLVLVTAPLLAAGIAALVPHGRPHRTAAGIPYLAAPCASLLWLREDPRFGAEVVLWLLLVVAATDTAAYAVGRLIGGARLAPRISPGKTWAGFAGGTALAILLGGAGGVALGWSFPLAALLACMLALSAQGGDLFESWLKRRIGVKDSGALLPGHGGILDRIDGLLVAALLLALLLAVSA